MNTQIDSFEHDAALAQCAQPRSCITTASPIALAEYSQRLERVRADARCGC